MPRRSAIDIVILQFLIIPMNQVDFGVSLRCPAGRVNMMATKVSAEFQGICDRQVGKVLISEGNDFTLSDQKSELVLSSRGETAELYSSNFRADGRCDLVNLGAFDQQVFEGGIRVLPVFGVREWLEGRVLLGVVKGWEVRWILEWY